MRKGRCDIASGPLVATLPRLPSPVPSSSPVLSSASVTSSLSTAFDPLVAAASLPSAAHPAVARFLALLDAALAAGTWVKLTLGHPAPDAADPTLLNLYVRPVTLKAGPHLSLLWRHRTRDITKNLRPPEALALIARLLGREFFDAHLFTTENTAQLETRPPGPPRLHLAGASGGVSGAASAATGAAAAAPVAASAVGVEGSHDRIRRHPIPAQACWLRALGVTNDRGLPRDGMAGKFRQIQKFAELVQHLLRDTRLVEATAPLHIVDMGCGKGYLTCALAALLGERATVLGIESRPELVALGNQIARDHGLPHLKFAAGTIASAPLAQIDVLVALHACDTATDDALARGVAAGARLLVVSPCCHKEVRAQLTAPPVLADALRHGIFQERQAEFATDALRAQLLEWAGYRTKVFEFISTEHTAKNLLLTAWRPAGTPISGAIPVSAADDAAEVPASAVPAHEHAQAQAACAERVRALAAFYGIRTQALARQLGFVL